MLGYILRYANLLDAQVWIWTNDSTSTEFNSFARQISTESALLSFQSLNECTLWNASLFGRRKTRKFTIEELTNTILQMVPKINDCFQTCSLLNVVLDSSIQSKNVLQNHCEIIFVCSRNTFHHYTGSDTDRRDE